MLSISFNLISNVITAKLKPHTKPAAMYDRRKTSFRWCFFFFRVSINDKLYCTHMGFIAIKIHMTMSSNMPFIHTFLWVCVWARDWKRRERKINYDFLSVTDKSRPCDKLQHAHHITTDSEKVNEKERA